MQALLAVSHAHSTIIMGYRRRGGNERQQELFFDQLRANGLEASSAPGTQQGVVSANGRAFVQFLKRIPVVLAP
mgnify:CR=1 FL=1